MYDQTVFGNPLRRPALLCLFIVLFTLSAYAQLHLPKRAPKSHSNVTVTEVDFHGWFGSYLLSNGKIEAVVVPAVGRVMKFAFADEENPIWDNRLLDGRAPDPKSTEWLNFGGDKSWPAPQSEWEKMTGRKWPPPVAFDSMPDDVRVEGDEVVLTSKVDPSYGIQEERRIKLDDEMPVMAITTTYRKVSGPAVNVAVWTITQFSDPQRVFVLLPAQSKFKEGYEKQMDATPKDLTVQGRLLSLARDTKSSSKIGTDGGSLLWMDEETAVRIDNRRLLGEYPDDGSSAEVYTNADPLPYVELETLGPLVTMNAGDQIERTNTYTLIRRTQKDDISEARHDFGVQ